MPRFRLTIEYDGTPYCGWQWQNNGPSVQRTLEGAIETFAGHAVRAYCAGRTDAGVHALHQVIHIDLDKPLRPDTVRDAANAHLRGKGISVLMATEVSGEFDARRSAIARHYLYRILNRRAPAALDVRRVWHIASPLNHAAMHEAAKILLGRHDFTTFRAANCQAKSPVKNLDQLDVILRDEEIHVIASARSFLHHQVRSMVGALVQVGLGRWDEIMLTDALNACDRTRCPGMAPAHGLYLTMVDYKDDMSKTSMQNV